MAAGGTAGAAARQGLQDTSGPRHAVQPRRTVGAGELVALIGPNGAGKTTCFNLVNGQLSPDRGTVSLNGERIDGLPPREIARRGVGRTFQVAATFASMTVRENVQMVFLSKHRALFDPWRPTGKLFCEETLALLERIGMAPQAERPANVLAYGDVKRLELAMALANDPVLLLMDEPTAGMAPEERNALMALTADLVRRAGRPLLIGADLERGAGQQAHRLTPVPPPAALASLDDDQVLRWAGSVTARGEHVEHVEATFGPQREHLRALRAFVATSNDVVRVTELCELARFCKRAQPRDEAFEALALRGSREARYVSTALVRLFLERQPARWVAQLFGDRAALFRRQFRELCAEASSVFMAVALEQRKHFGDRQRCNSRCQVHALPIDLHGLLGVLPDGPERLQHLEPA